MTMYVRFNLVDSARTLFDEMKERSNVLWTVIIGGYAKLDDFAEMFKLFSGMRHSNVSVDYLFFVSLFLVDDILVGSSLHALVVKYGFDLISVIANSLVNMYARCRDLSSTRNLFDLVKADNFVLYTSMIATYMHNCCPDEALSIYENMLAVNVKPNEITLATALLACADAGFLSMGQKVEDHINVNGFDSDLQIQTSLIHMYCKCGSINRARDVFNRLSTKDTAVWSSMIVGYATIEDANEVVQLFEIMINQGLRPDAIIFVGLLPACSHAGMVEDGMKIFARMQKEFGIKPGNEHFSCLVDLLGRSGQWELVLEGLYQMPDKSYSKVLGPLLSACKTYGNIKVGEAVANRLSSLEPNYARSYILMSSIYASVGRWKDAATMRKMVLDSRIGTKAVWVLTCLYLSKLSMFLIMAKSVVWMSTILLLAVSTPLLLYNDKSMVGPRIKHWQAYAHAGVIAIAACLCLDTIFETINWWNDLPAYNGLLLGYYIILAGLACISIVAVHFSHEQSDKRFLVLVIKVARWHCLNYLLLSGALGLLDGTACFFAINCRFLWTKLQSSKLWIVFCGMKMGMWRHWFLIQWSVGCSSS